MSGPQIIHCLAPPLHERLRKPKNILLHIIKTLCHIYKETIKNYDFNDSLPINFSGPQISFL